jgi:probable F420-dependent oxidoreductase
MSAASVPTRPGITVPLAGVSLSEHRTWFEEIAALGFTDVWSSEASGPDAFTPLALAAAWAPTLRLGTAIVPAYTRGPATLAQSVAAMCDAAPGRFALGIGTSSEVIVHRWNGLAFDAPYARVRDMVRFLRVALAGEKVTMDCESFSVAGFQLASPPTQPPPILISALRPGMLRLAGRDGDGAILNWLSAEDVKTVVPYVGEGKEIVARIFVIPSEDVEYVRAIARRAVTAYLTVPVYAQFHAWLGREEMLRPVWDAWNAGERRRALEAVPDELVDQLFVWGTPQQIREHLARYAANGVTTPIPSFMGEPSSLELRSAIRSIAPVQ